MGREWYWSRSIARQEKESTGCMSGMLHYFDFHHLLLFNAGGSRTTPTISSPEVQLPTPHLEGVEAPRNSLELDSAKVLSSSAIEEEFYDVPVARQVAPAPIALAKDVGSLKTLLLEEERRSTQQAETPRTPSVVARLMGLEVLPDQVASPAAGCRKSPHLLESKEHARKANKKKKKPDGELKGSSSPPPRQPLQSINCNVANKHDTGSRSLPDTPRSSSATAARTSWDSDPRLSLQRNKENANNRTMQEFSYLCEVAGDYSLPHSPSPYMAKLRKKDLPKHQDENKSMRSHFYAREIVKQVKESISSRRGGSGGVEEDRIRSKRTGPAEKKLACDNEDRNQSRYSSMVSPPPPPCSPPKPVRFLEPPKSKVEEYHKPKPRQPPKAPTLPTASPTFLRARDHADAKAVKMVPSKCNKKASYERFTERIKKPQTPSETAERPDDSVIDHLFIPSSCPPQPASVLQKHVSDHEKQCSSIPSSVCPSPSPASPGQTNQSPFIKAQEQAWARGVITSGLTALKPEKNHLRPVPTEQDPEYRYVRSILEHARITGPVVPTVIRWYSASLPVDPIIFHRMELKLPLVDDGQQGPLRHRWNRKLLFHLVEEILVDLLTLPSSGDPASVHLRRCQWQSSDYGDKHRIESGEMLLRQLWSQIRGFPAADCQVVGDIDALVAGDLPEGKVRRLLRHPAVAEEAEDVALEVEEEIWESLLAEAAGSLASGGDLRKRPGALNS